MPAEVLYHCGTRVLPRNYGSAAPAPRLLELGRAFVWLGCHQMYRARRQRWGDRAAEDQRRRGVNSGLHYLAGITQILACLIHSSIRGLQRPASRNGAVAGKAERYRGAYAILRPAVAIDVADGRRAHSLATEWWRTHMLAEREALYE